MAADNEARLISALVRQGAMKEASRRGVDGSWFYVDDHRLVYEWMLRYYGKYLTTPSAATLKSEFPSYRLLAVTDPAEYFIDQLAEFNRETSVIKVVRDASKELKGRDTSSALALLRAGLEKVESFSPNPVRMLQLNSLASIKERWKRQKHGSPKKMLGLPTGYPSVDEATNGLQPGQLVIVVAEPKQGKTTLLSSIAVNAHYEADVPTVLVSFEMNADEMSDRVDSIRAGVPLGTLRTQSLSHSDLTKYGDMLADFEARAPFHVADAGQAGLTLSSVSALVSDHRPGLLVVDGVYMMTDEITGERNTPQSLTNLTRGFKRMAQRLEIPILISTQALSWKTGKGRSLRGDSAGYSSSFAQDADVMLGLEPLGDSGAESQLRRLRVILSRNSGLVDSTINFDYSLGNFAEVR